MPNRCISLVLVASSQLTCDLPLRPKVLMRQQQLALRQQYMRLKLPLKMIFLKACFLLQFPITLNWSRPIFPQVLNLHIHGFCGSSSVMRYPDFPCYIHMDPSRLPLCFFQVQTSVFHPGSFYCSARCSTFLMQRTGTSPAASCASSYAGHLSTRSTMMGTRS